MNHRQGIRFDSSENVTSLSQPGIFHPGSPYSEKLGAPIRPKMPVYGGRANEDAVRSNLPFIKNIALQRKDNQGNVKYQHIIFFHLTTILPFEG